MGYRLLLLDRIIDMAGRVNLMNFIICPDGGWEHNFVQKTTLNSTQNTNLLAYHNTVPVLT